MIIKNRTELLELLGFDTNENPVLLYRASRDGFSAKFYLIFSSLFKIQFYFTVISFYFVHQSSFHQKVDRKARTLVIVKTQGYPNIFGGYTERSWGNYNTDIDGSYVHDSFAFLFSLVNKWNHPKKLIFRKNELFAYAIFDGPNDLATFGNGLFHIVLINVLDKLKFIFSQKKMLRSRSLYLQ